MTFEIKPMRKKKLIAKFQVNLTLGFPHPNQKAFGILLLFSSQVKVSGVGVGGSPERKSCVLRSRGSKDKWRIYFCLVLS